MLIGYVVLQLSIQIQVDVGELPVHTVPQGTICSFVYINVQEGRWSFDSVFMVNWMLG
jgi:hypothetical protein